MTKTNNMNIEDIKKEIKRIEEDDIQYYYTEGSLAYYMEDYDKPAKVKVKELWDNKLKLTFPVGLLPFVFYWKQPITEVNIADFENFIIKKELVDNEKEYYQIINQKLKDHKKYLENELERIKDEMGILENDKKIAEKSLEKVNKTFRK